MLKEVLKKPLWLEDNQEFLFVGIWIPQKLSPWNLEIFENSISEKKRACTNKKFFGKEDSKSFGDNLTNML